MAFFNDTKQKFLIKATGHRAPLQQMQKEVYSPGRNEQEWLRIKVNAAGGTPTGYISDMWKQLNGLLGYTVANTVNANRLIYWQKNS